MTTLWFAQALLPEGWRAGVRFHLADGRFARIEPGVDPAPGDERGGTAVPGMANLHSHAFQRIMAGFAETRAGPDGDDFWGWRELMYRLLATIEPDDLEAVAAMAFVEMLESGFTRAGEFHYLHHRPDGRPYDDPAEMAAAVAGAAATTGIALTLLPVFYAHAGFGGLPPSEAQRRFITDVDAFARLREASARAVSALPNAVLGVAPHSLRAVTPDELSALVALTAAGPIHLHIAEQTKEVDDCLAWSGQRPVEWLLDHQPVDRRWCLVHATHVTPAECAAVAASGAVVGLCPVTEANLGDGIFPAAEFIDAGGTFGVGSDSNVRIDLAEELRLLEYGQRLTRRRRTVLTGGESSTGRSLFDRALAGGRLALGGGEGLVAGASADLVGLTPAVLDGGDRALDHWLFATGRIDRVWRAGREAVADGRHRDRTAVERRFAAVARRLLA
ncbi:MAG: formimidoylglutamate deiminase [Qipengyuania sp.]|nr:formimidoylglutamate deiminase [Qipengyuania sp.]